MESFIWDKPIFILGNPRSGTSLLRLMLHSHSEICIPPESHFFLWLEEKYGIWNFQDLDSYLDDLHNATKFETWSLNRVELTDYLNNLVPESYAELTSLIYKFYALKENKEPRFWGDKNSLWIDKLPKIMQYYPNAFIVHIIRDGRDVACSYKEINLKNVKSPYAPNLPNEVSEIAETWNLNNIALENFLKSVPKSQYVQIKYEHLLTSPKTTLQKVLEPLELKITSGQLEYYLKNKKDIEPEEFFNWKEKLVQPPDTSNIGKYQTILSKKEIYIFNNIANHSLLKYNYI
jgi:hypothetical protein